MLCPICKKKLEKNEQTKTQKVQQTEQEYRKTVGEIPTEEWGYKSGKQRT